MEDNNKVSTHMTKDYMAQIKAQGEQMVTFSIVIKEKSLKLAILEGCLDQNLRNMEFVNSKELSTKENRSDMFPF